MSRIRTLPLAPKLSSAASTRLAKWQWQSLVMLRAVGWPGWVALALMVICSAVWLGVYRPGQQQLRRLQAQGHALEQDLLAGKTRPVKVVTPADQIEQFYRLLASEKDITSALGKIETLAQRDGLQLKEAEFKLGQQPGERLASYAIILPVKADYKTLRHFIRDVLHDLPGIALEEVSVRRDDARTDGLEGRLRFVLYLAQATTRTEVRTDAQGRAQVDAP